MTAFIFLGSGFVMMAFGIFIGFVWGARKGGEAVEAEIIRKLEEGE